MKNYLNIVRKILADVSYNSFTIIGSGKKIVSFTFDDVPKSAFENAGKILKKHDVNGTFYVAFSLMEKPGAGGLFTISDIEDCLKSGNEIACHTYSHFSFFKTLNGKFINTDLAKNHDEFKKLNLNSDLTNFSYPFGAQTRIAKKHVSKFYKTSRGIDAGVNAGKVDLNNLKAIQLYEGKTSLQKIDDIISDIEKNGGWLIFYTHDVKDDYTRIGCSPAYLEAVVEKVIKAGFEIKNIRQVTDILA